MTGVCCAQPSSANAHPCWIRASEKAMTTSQPNTAAPSRSRGENRSTRRWRRKWAPRLTPTAAPRNTTHTKHPRAISSYHVKVLASTYREKTPSMRSAERTAIRTRQTHSTLEASAVRSTRLLRCLHGRRDPVHPLLAHLGGDQIVGGSHALLERLEVLDLVDLDAGLLDELEVGLLLFDLCLPIHRAGGLARLVDRLAEIRRQGLILLQVGEPGDRRIRVLGQRLILRHLVEPVGNHREHRG